MHCSTIRAAAPPDATTSNVGTLAQVAIGPAPHIA